jgi:hypothetical protein
MRKRSIGLRLRSSLWRYLRWLNSRSALGWVSKVPPFDWHCLPRLPLF